MQTNLLWTGLEYHSLENCLVKAGETGSEITSTIIGSYEGKIFKVEYRIETNPNWETVFFEIISRHSDQVRSIRFEGDGKGIWTNDGKIASQFTGCIDVDISLTPFTNTLPIRRLNLSRNQPKEIHVLYCDVLEQQLKAVRQKYTCVSNSTYYFENVPNDFEAILEVDEAGFVIDYQNLFQRTAVLQTNYR
ncbi:putative glycolipid-binding domain-containing protein [Flavihumibacter solisilvae]|uniref:putative glycolipid-binding domain-containing protein n=1 Tax=Flavihumibacter solisilvae TaxID=1349421 RepID=UPI00068D1128|nr:putative glycolipid-binding domain-containing protein [Flavihumibacter solisilvae]